MKRLLLALVLLAMLLPVPAQAVDPSAFARPPMPDRLMVPKGTHLVKYRVEADNGASLTYMAHGSTEQREVPRSGSLRFVALPGEFLYVSAQNMGESGEVTCRIYVDGELVQDATSEGAYSIASCEYMLP